MDIQNEKIRQLADWLDIHTNEIEPPKEDENQAYFRTPYGAFEVMTKDEAAYEHAYSTQGLFRELGISIYHFGEEFTQEIIHEYVDQDRLHPYLNGVIAYDVASMTDNEVVKQAEKLNLDWADDYRRHEMMGDAAGCSQIIRDNRISLVPAMVEDAKQAYNGKIADWIADNVGESALYNYLNKHLELLDIEAITSRWVERDGYGAFFASDRATNTIGDFFVFAKDYDDSQHDGRSFDFQDKVAKAQCLADWLKIDLDEIEMPDKNTPEAEYKTPFGSYALMANYETTAQQREFINAGGGNVLKHDNGLPYLYIVLNDTADRRSEKFLGNKLESKPKKRDAVDMDR